MATSTSLKRNANHLSATAVNSKKSKTNSSITSFFGAPKPKNGDSNRAMSSSSSTFNKEKWVASLTPEQKDLLQLEIDTLDESWLAQLKDEVTTPEFLALKRFLKQEKKSGVKIFPPENEIYSWSRHTPLHKVKVVIVGQDPYHNHNQAHGLAFSVRPPTPAPPSLVNIYKGIKNDYPYFQAPPNKGGLLTPWAERGVLLLNTQKAIDIVARVRRNGVVFLAWGTPAGKRVSGINKEKHCVLQSVHPSPLSASRGFFTCGHFKKCNDWLSERYGAGEIIDWSLSPASKNALPIEKNPSSSDTPTVQRKEQKLDAAKAAKTAVDEFEGDDIDVLEAFAATEKAEEKGSKVEIETK